TVRLKQDQRLKATSGPFHISYKFINWSQILLPRRFLPAISKRFLHLERGRHHGRTPRLAVASASRLEDLQGLSTHHARPCCCRHAPPRTLSPACRSDRRIYRPP